MMDRRLAARGSTAEYFRKRIGTEPMNGSRRICLGTAGDFRGRTIAGLFTTVHRHVRTGSHGVNERSLSGGTRHRASGSEMILPISLRILRPIPRAIFAKGVA